MTLNATHDMTLNATHDMILNVTYDMTLNVTYNATPNITADTCNISRITGTYERLSVRRLNEYYVFLDIWIECHDNVRLLRDNNYLVFSVDVRVLVFWFRFFTIPQLHVLCVAHGVLFGKLKLKQLISKLLEHQCSPSCSRNKYVFKTLSRPRQYVARVFTGPANETFESTANAPTQKDLQGIAFLDPPFQPEPQTVDPTPKTDHLAPPTKQLKELIIKEWQSSMSTTALRSCVCATCSTQILVEKSTYTEAATLQLGLLRNDDLPAHVPRPNSYNFNLYERALLDPRGMEYTQILGRLRLCKSCGQSLENGLMPKFALSNWLYYGIDVLPHSVREDLARSSVFERMMIARARANTICCRFNARGASNPAASSTTNILQNSRRGVRGNVMVAPLDVVRMNSIIPPPVDAIRDTLCAVFVGNTKPSASTIAKLRPILVRRTRIKNIIGFLVENNSHYLSSTGLSVSHENLATMLPEGVSEGVPSSVQVDYIALSDAVEGATSDYAPRYDVTPGHNEWSVEDLLIENVGYTDGDDTPSAYFLMKEKALKHCLTGKPFVSAGKGTVAIDDFSNPSLLTWLYPHLDPWGIGGFDVPKRVRRITMEEQVKHLLSVAESPFMRDSEFPFVFYNIMRKKQVSTTLRFAIPLNTHTRVLEDLQSVDPQTLLNLNNRCKLDITHRPENEEEKVAYRLLHALRLISRHVPGSDGYKLMLRNQIKSMIYRRCTPALFVTASPSDVDNPIVRLFAGDDICLETMTAGEELSSWERKLFAAKNPAACAIMFDRLIRQFIHTILRFGRNENGLYGKCTAYFGTVEAQGKGTLHCHMLIWLDGHVSPQKLRDCLAASEIYQSAMKAWLDSVIMTGFPSDSNKIDDRYDRIKRVRHHDLGNSHPGALPSPSFSRMGRTFWDDFAEDVVSLLYEYNWHEHQATCWKYLKRGQEKSNNNCRLRMDGKTRPETTVNPETFALELRRLHPWIASYTDVVMFLLRCNMEIKFVGSGDAAKAFLYYVTDYITKPALPVHAGMAALTFAIKKLADRSASGATVTPLSAVTTAVNSMMGRQEISHPQVMSYLIGGGDHYTSDTFVVLHWGAILRYVKQWYDCDDSEHSTDIPRGADDSVCLDFSAGKPTYYNQRIDYSLRSSNLVYESMNLYDFVSLTAKTPHRSEIDIFTKEGAFISGDHPQHATHHLVMRRTAKTPVIVGPAFTNPSLSRENEEKWAQEMLVLFKPWRDPGHLKQEDEPWLEAYERFAATIDHNIAQTISNIGVLRECKDARSFGRDDNERAPLNHPDDGDIDVYASFAAEDFSIAELEERLRLSRPESKSMAELLGNDTAALFEMCLPQHLIVDTAGNIESESPVRVCPTEEKIIAEFGAILARRKKRRFEELDSHEGSSRGHKKAKISKTQQTDTVGIETLGLGAIRYAASQANNATDVARQIARDMNLEGNDGQMKAFMTVANHVCNEAQDQLLMHVSGVGGTGKSHVIKSLVKLFEKISKRHELKLGAPTGIAATLIDGQTLHSLVMSTPSGKGTNKKRLIAMWIGVKYLIVDEISMVGACFLSSFSSRLRESKGDEPFQASRPFGGLNVIFFGDMAQLKPPAQCSLYDHTIVANPSFERSRNAEGVTSTNGVFLWRQVNTVVKLVKNHRHAADPVYAQFLDRLRVGKCSNVGTEGQPSDLDLIRSRTLSSLSYNPAQLSEFSDAPVIVGTKAIRDTVNKRKIEYYSTKINAEVHMYHSYDTINSSRASKQASDVLWDLPSSVTKDAIGRLAIFIGMKMMVTENIAVDLGIVNGCEGIVQGIRYDNVEGIRYAAAVYLRVQGMNFSFPGLPENVVPILPSTTYITHAPLERTSVGFPAFGRKQLPLVAAYSYTDFKAQGRTLERAIVDLASARGQGAYVMLSRVKCIKGIAILRWFPSSKITGGLSQELRTELDRLDSIANVQTA